MPSRIDLFGYLSAWQSVRFAASIRRRGGCVVVPLELEEDPSNPNWSESVEHMIDRLRIKFAKEAP